jgi:hypothetical protein
MKRTVLTYGLISGVVVSGMMLAGLPFLTSGEYRKGEIFGYTSIVLAMLITFFGVRAYREKTADGRLSFGRALGVGLLITLVSCTCYVVTWETMYFGVMPGLGDSVVTMMVAKAKASGASMEEATIQAQSFKTMYDNPAVNAALTFIEPFPIGLVVSLLSAAILRRK